MKGRKLLSAIIAGAMVLGTMSFPAFAESETGVEYNGITYDSFAEARDAVAQDATDITYTIHGKVMLPDGYITNIVGSAANAETVTFKAADGDATAELAMDGTGVNIIGLDLTGAVKTVNYDGLILSRANGSWKPDVGHANNYFTTAMRGVSDGIVNYTSCTFPNGSCNNSYSKTVYTNCKFNNDTEYGLWIYGGKTEVTGATFTGAKGVQAYSEDENADVITKITDSTFNGIRNKPAIISGTKGTVTLENITTIDCEYGLLQTKPKDGNASLPCASVTIDGEEPAYVAKVGSSLYTDQYFAEKEAQEKGTTAMPVVAKVNGQFYSTLADAVAAANSLPGDNNITIEITKTGVYDPFTITRNNVTVQGIVGATAEESTVIKNTDTNVINVYNQNITLKNLWIDDSVGHTSYKSAVNVMGSRNPYDNLTVDSCRLVGNGQVGSIAFYYHTTKLTITNCTFENFERGYYGCGDNNAMEMLTVTGNTFNNVKVPVDGYWGKVYTGSEEYNIVITDNTFNPDTWGTSYIQLWDYVQYGHYLGWNSCEAGSAIKAKIANNAYNGTTVFYPTHCNVNTVTKIDIAESDEQSLDIIPRYFVALPDEITDADITYSDGSEIDLWNTTKYKVAGSKKLLYTVPTGSFKVTIEKGELKSEEPLTVTAPNEGEILGENIPAITLTDDTFIADEIEVTFVPTADENVYDIVLDGNDKEIYEFVSAEIQFVNSSNGYEIDGTNDINVIANTENSDRYGFYLKDGEVSNRITATKIKIGQVTFPAQGTISFKVDADNSKVVATEYNTHLEKYYTAADEMQN